MSDTNPAIDLPASESPPATRPDDADHEDTDGVGSAPALRSRDSGGGDVVS
jgi:hypothetical protein